MSNHTDALLNILTQASESTLFQPTNDQKRAKSNFWTHFGTDQLSPLPSAPTLAIALRYGSDNRISQWWTLSGFQDWFFNREEFKQRMEYLSNLALDNLEDILISPMHQASDKLSAIKLIMQVAQKTPKATPDEDGGLGKLIGNMNKVQLEEFIRNNLRLLPTNPTIEVSADTSEVSE